MRRPRGQRVSWERVCNDLREVLVRHGILSMDENPEMITRVIVDMLKFYLEQMNRIKGVEYDNGEG